jgi:hypothetical protein
MILLDADLPLLDIRYPHFQEKLPVPALTPEEWLTENVS